MTPKLSESAQRALAYLAERLGSGFTGTIRIDAQDGGVRDLREESRPLEPKQMGMRCAGPKT